MKLIIKEEKQMFRTPYDAANFYELTYYKGGKEDIIKDLNRRGYSAMFISRVFEELEEMVRYNSDYDPFQYQENAKKVSRGRKLTEKSNFDSIAKAVRYYYPKWYYDDMSVNDIFDSLEKLGHSQDFIDAVIAGITEKYEDEEDYELDESVEIEVKNKGILEVPEGKNVDDLPMSHFEKLVKKNGLSKITKALNNLQVWNKNDDKKLSKWAGDMIDKLTKKYGKNESLKESGMYDYYDAPDNAFNTYNDMPTPEDDWWASIPSNLRAVVHEMEEQGWEGVGFTTTGVEYCISIEDKNRPELSYEMCVTIYDRDDSVSLSKYVDIFDWDKEKEISRIPNTSGVTEFRTPQDVKKFTQWFKRLGTSFSTKESVKIRKREQTIDEGVAASLLTIKNQLMNKLGSAFKSIGGSMNPKVTVYREDDPDTSFDITTDGKNVDIVPKYDGIPDTVHKKRGIAFMRAVNVLYDFIMDTLRGNGKLATENVRAHKRRKRRK
jgi:hypothetical protein